MPLERIDPDTIHAPFGYSHVVRATGDTTVYLSGQVGIRPDGSVAEGLAAQANEVFRNLGRALEAAYGVLLSGADARPQGPVFTVASAAGNQSSPASKAMAADD